MALAMRGVASVQCRAVRAEYGVVPEERVQDSPPPDQPDGENAPALVRRFIGRLSAAYLRLQAATAGGDTPELDEQLQSLLLAEAAIRYGGLAADSVARPFHVAVLGPTQTGKSTLVNLLLGCRAAQVSALAGFTVHPQGFWIAPAEADANWVAELFPGWRRCEVSELKCAELEAYALTRVEPGSAVHVPAGTTAGRLALPPCVVWDTPDFDSLAARHYAQGVLQVMALADLYVLVLSPEKYSDLSVWRMLVLLETLRRPLVICVNKLAPDGTEPIICSLRERLAERGQAWGTVPIVPLPYDPVLAAGGWPELPASASPLFSLGRAGQSGAAGKPDRIGRTQRMAGVQALVRRHWADWVAPVRAEHAALADWERAVRAAGTKFMAVYVRDYLDHPQRYDNFRRAAIELLELLEIPKVGSFMAQARRAVTWPARQIFAAGQAWWRERRPRGKEPNAVHSLGAEAAVLVDTLEALLIELQRDVARRCSPGTAGCVVWQALERKLVTEGTRLRVALEAGVRQHHERMIAESRGAANRLYAALQRQPARLAALRTARATLDVGAVLLAVKTGGLTPMDALWAPATWAATSLLMEGFAGLEMAREARELKVRQRAAVQEQFVERTLVAELIALDETLETDGLLAISRGELRAAAQALATWEAGS